MPSPVLYENLCVLALFWYFGEVHCGLTCKRGKKEHMSSAQSPSRVGGNPAAPHSARGHESVADEREVSRVNKSLQRIVAACLVVAAVVFCSPLMEQAGFPAFSILNGFLGASLQALAFLIIGVVASVAVQVFVSDEVLRRIFPDSTLGSIGAALALSVCLPVCDCSSIPLFRSLVARKVPLPAAITFLLAAPVANPIVVWSTYFAFNGEWTMVLCRAGIGLAVAVIVALSFLVHKPSAILADDSAGATAGAAVGATGGVIASEHRHGGAMEASLYDPSASMRTRLLACVAHARADFFDIARYLMVGIGLASIFKNVNAAYNLVNFSSVSTGVGIFVMMLVAFVLSLCSSSDAVIGRIFAVQMPAAPVLSFLVFGPMIDVKNVLMLSAHFTRGFIMRVAASAFVTTGVLVFALSATGVLA
jgi:uncharacterized membrane protein YraQ (UPF0718 family)